MGMGSKLVFLSVISIWQKFRISVCWCAGSASLVAADHTHLPMVISHFGSSPSLPSVSLGDSNLQLQLLWRLRQEGIKFKAGLDC